MLKAGKIELVKDLVKEVEKAKSVVLVNYTGLNVKAQQELKRRLNEVGARMVIVKNTLLKRTILEAKLDEKTTTDDILSGQTAIVIAEEDAIAPLQVIGKFAKENDIPKFKVGIVEGSFQDSANLVKLSTLPSRDVLLSQVLGSLVSPMYGLVGTLQSPLQQLIYTLQNARKSENSENSVNQNV